MMMCLNALHGCLQVKHHIELKEQASPVVHAPQKAQISLHDRLHKELNKS